MADGCLQRIYAACLTTPATWGTNSCLHFAADVSQAQIGVDPIEKIRGKFRNRREALALERSFGRNRKASADGLAEFCGWESVNTIYAKPGALGLVRAGRKLIAACLTPEGWTHRTRLGFRIVRTAECAWTTSQGNIPNVCRDRFAFARPYLAAPE
jgi:hypothetical protein